MRGGIIPIAGLVAMDITVFKNSDDFKSSTNMGSRITLPPIFLSKLNHL